MIRIPGLGAVAKLIVAIGADTKGLERSLDSAENRVKSFAGRVESRIDTTAFKVVGGAIAGIGLALGGVLTVAGLYAAKVQMLGTVMKTIGKTAGYSAEELDKYEENIRDVGISTEDARKIMILFMQSELDLADAVRLCQVAQDLATFSELDSSQAAVVLTEAIATGNTERLRQFGIMETLDSIRKREGKGIEETGVKLGILHAIFEKGETVKGAYAAAMEDVGKRLTSLPRLIKDAKLAFGEDFIPVIGVAVDALSELLKVYTALDPITKRIITLGAMVASALALIVSPILLILAYLPNIAGGWAMIKGVAVPVIAAIIGGLESLYIVLLSIPEPITKIIALIIGLILAAILVWKNWDKIGKFLIEVWDNLEAELTETWKSIQINAAKLGENTRIEATKTWNSISDFFVTIWDKIVTTVSNFRYRFLRVWDYIRDEMRNKVDEITRFLSLSSIWNSVLSALNSFKNSFLRVWDAIGAGALSFKSVFSGIWYGIKESVRSALNGIINIVNNFIRNFQNSINSVITSLNKVAGTYISTIYLPTIPGLQRGGRIMEAGFVDVGERGRERIFLPKGAEVRPLAKGVGTTPEIHLHLEYNEELTSKTFVRLFGQYIGAINK